MGKLDRLVQTSTPGVRPWDYLRPWKACWKCEGREVFWDGASVRDCPECQTGYHPDRKPGDFFLWLSLCLFRLLSGAFSILLTAAFALIVMYLIGAIQ